MFGARIFGHGDGDTTSTKSSPDLQLHSKSSKAKGKEKERNGRGEIMMVWFLRRWGPLSETLFEVVDDAKLGVLHRNKLLRRDSLGKAAITAYTAAYEATSGAHDTVKGEVYDQQEEGERNDELVERGLRDGDTSGNVEPVNVIRSPLTVHVPSDSQKRGISPPSTFARKCLNSLSLPEGNAVSSRGITWGPKEDSPQPSSASSGSSSSSLPPYTARPSRAPNTIETDSNPTNTRCLVLQTERSDTRQGEVLPCDTDLYHSTPKKSNVSERMLDFTNPSDEKPCLSRVMAPQHDEGSGIIGTNEDEDESSSRLCPALTKH